MRSDNSRIRVRQVAGLAAIAGILLLNPASAEPSAEDQAVYQAYLDFGNLVKGGRVTANWMPDGSSFWISEGGPNNRSIIKIDPDANTVEPLFDLARLRAVLTDALGHEPAGSGVPFDQFQFLSSSLIAFSLENKTYTLDLTSYVLEAKQSPSTFSFGLVKSEAERGVPTTFLREQFQGLGPLPHPESMSPDGQWIAGIENHNLTLRATVDGISSQVTSDGTEDASWDLESLLWNAWSPNSQQLAITRHHSQGLPRIPTIKWLKPLEEVHEVITIPAGADLYRSELYIFDMIARVPRHIDLGSTNNQYLRVLTWAPDGSELYIARYNRTLSKVRIQAVNAHTGEVRHVLSEASETFLTNHHEAIWATETGFSLLPDGSGFLWNSERSGWDHLYLYDSEGELLRQLTSGEWPVKDVVRVDQAGGRVYFTGHGDQSRPYDTHLYRVNLDGSGFAQITEGKGQHDIQLSPNLDFLLDTFSSVDTPPKTVLRSVDGSVIRELGSADVSRLESIGWTAPQEHVVKAADGETDLWVTLHLPYDFDPTHKYPVVEYIYAGPQTTMRSMDFGDQSSFFSRMINFSRALAQLGFVVVALDARGTPERSKAFHDVVYMNWGNFEIADHAGAIRQLADKLEFLDLERVGIWGASWGGHFAFRAMTQAPELYKVGVAAVPGFDSRRFILYEVYLGMPQENKAAYDTADVFHLAPKLEGELLLTGGLNDTGTQIDLFKMSEQLIRLGKQHRTMSYPNTGHGYLGATGEYDMDLKKNFFVELLKP